jgi:shikimate kinase / 3-dehydroquinate synthase
MDRPLLLNGFMATGKSTLGRALAEQTGRPFADLDQLVEARAGVSVATLFARDGEAAFRRLEQATLLELIESWPSRYGEAPIVALGGGALLARSTRLVALDRCMVVTLDASSEEIARRAATQGERPLLGNEPVQRIEALLEQRANAYAEAHARFTTDGRTPESLVDPIVQVWKRKPIAVAAAARSYSVETGSAVYADFLPRALGKPSKLLIVTDETVQKLHLARLQAALPPSLGQVSVLALEPGEEHKRIAALERIWQALYDQEADRKSLILAFGGGVVSDIAGFAAATWMRGIPWVGVPTTLLAMVDASVGGKTAIDFHAAKNTLGAFWQPASVLCDVDWLATESLRGFRGALAEVVKTALIGDVELYALLESRPDAVLAREPSVVEELVRRSVRVKARIVSADERESGLRALLNLGHTLGHAFEAAGNYTRFSHGEAVSLGLVAALRIGVALKRTPSELATRVQTLLATLGLPTEIDREMLAAALPLLGRDKKRAATQLRFIVAEQVGRVSTAELPLTELARLSETLA